MTSFQITSEERGTRQGLLTLLSNWSPAYSMIHFGCLLILKHQCYLGALHVTISQFFLITAMLFWVESEFA